MSCDTFQHQLLESESPDRPDAELQAHLDGCAACREWQARLLQIEQGVRRLHVPSSATRDAFLLDLILPDNPSQEAPAPAAAAAAATSKRSSEPVVRLSLSAPALQPSPPWREVAWRWRYAGAGIAAALALFAFVSMSLDRNKPNGDVAKKDQADPLVASLMRENLALVTADKDKPEERAKALAHIAADLDVETRALDPAKEADLIGLLSQLRTQVTESLQKLAPQPDARPTAANTAAVADARRVKQLKRNRNLIQALVEGGVRLAKLDDTLERAESCKQLAKSLASEIREAAQHREGERTAEMGQHFRDLLQLGVAVNIRSVRPSLPHGSLAEKHMYDVRDSFSGIAQSLEMELAARTELQSTLDAIRGGRVQVENAARG
ncbi:hypothetical protein AYO40_06230 [Planctomycetaceae bacterium SCGC AG-212-D15]|nr:hypothetical protein AYO40_06230 [Planctomycetaceae bacterium SCGC AG-212-D15]